MASLSRRFLIADDDAPFRTYVRVLVEEVCPGTEVVAEAIDGAETVELAVELRPDVVLLDFAMPRLDGLAAAEQIKDSLPEALIVLISGTDSAGSLAERAAIPYIAKGVLSAERMRDVVMPLVEA